MFLTNNYRTIYNLIFCSNLTLINKIKIKRPKHIETPQYRRYTYCIDLLRPTSYKIQNTVKPYGNIGKIIIEPVN